MPLFITSPNEQLYRGERALAEPQLDSLKNAPSRLDGSDENLEVSYRVSAVAATGCMASVIVH